MPSNMMKRPLTLACCLMILFCWLNGPCDAAATPAAPQTELRIGYQPFSSPTGAIFEVMKRDRLLRKALERQNITLSFIPAMKGSDSAALFMRGGVEAIAMGDMPMIELALDRPITTIAQFRHNFVTVVAPRGATPRDLKGKRIGNVFASAGHYALLKTLRNAGLSERDVTLVPLDVNEMSGALVSGSVYAVAAWEPTPSQLIAKHPDRFSSVGRQSSSGYLSVSRTFAGKHPDSLSLLAAGMARAIQWLAKDGANRQQAAAWNKAAMLKLSGKASAYSTEELRRQLTADLQAIRYSARLPVPKKQDKNLLFDEFTFLKDVGKLPETARWESISNSFDHSIMERIYQNPVASSLNRFDYELR